MIGFQFYFILLKRVILKYRLQLHFIVLRTFFLLTPLFTASVLSQKRLFITIINLLCYVSDPQRFVMSFFDVSHA